MENFVITLTFLLIGILLKRLPIFPEESGTVLNLFVIYISLPALILLKVPELLFSKDILVPALMPWAMLLFSFGLVTLFSKIFRWDRPTTGCLLLVIPLGNTSFLGVPMVKSFFGEEAIIYALLYDQLGSFLALATYGSLIVALYGDEENKPTTVSVIRKVISFPPFIALICAFLLRAFSYPVVIGNILTTLSATLVPVVMIAVGFQLKFQFGKEVTSPLTLGLFIKLIIAPVTALLICRLSGLEGITSDVSVFEAGMPPMVSAGALAIMANLSPTLTAALVGIGIIVSFATLPLLHQLLLFV